MMTSNRASGTTAGGAGAGAGAGAGQDRALDSALLNAQIGATTAWRRDLKTLYQRTSERFADVCWAVESPAQASSSQRSASASSAGSTAFLSAESPDKSISLEARDGTALERKPSNGGGSGAATPTGLISFGNTSIALGKDTKGKQLIFAHKALIYARAPSSFQTKYLKLKTPAAQLGPELANASEVSLPSIVTHHVEASSGAGSSSSGRADASEPTPTGLTVNGGGSVRSVAAGRRKSAQLRGAFPPTSFGMKRGSSGLGTASGNNSESESESVAPSSAGSSVRARGSLANGKRISAPITLTRRSSIGSGTSMMKSRDSVASMAAKGKQRAAADASDGEEARFGSLRGKVTRPPPRSGSLSATEDDGADRLSIASTALSYNGSMYSDASSAHTVGRSPYLPRGTYTPGPTRPIPLDEESTSAGLLEAILEYLYTGEESMQHTFAFLYDDASAGKGLLLGNGDEAAAGKEARLEKLQQDLTYMWRSKLFSDVKIVLDDGAFPLAGSNGSAAVRNIPDTMSVLSLPMDMEEDPEDEVTSFSAHRFILASRSPYFAAQLLSPFSDARAPVLHLPSPPFTPAALHFALGFIYSGTLAFSNRSFDLATAFQLWRAGAYLQVDTLQSVVSALITHEFCHSFACTAGPPSLGASAASKAASTRTAPCKNCVRRVPRTLAFASCHDVNDAQLLDGARRAVSGPQFGAYWNKDVGNLDYGARSALVDAVCERFEQHPAACVGTVRQLALVSARIEVERAVGWVDALRWMIEGVEARLKTTLEAQLEAVVQSEIWQKELISNGFNADVLEKLLLLLVDALSEKRCAQIYQVLVGTVLLREEDPPQGQERQMIEDARSGIVRYIKRRWISVRAAGGFDGLEKWALKEISDEIDVKPDDMLLPKETKPVGPKSRTGLVSAAKPTVPATPARTTAATRGRTSSGSTSVMNRPAGAAARSAVRDGEREAGPINLRAAAVNRSAARAVSSSSSTVATPGAKPPAPSLRTTSLNRVPPMPPLAGTSRLSAATQSVSARASSSTVAASRVRRLSNSSSTSNTSTSSDASRPARAPSSASLRSVTAPAASSSASAEGRKRVPSSSGSSVTAPSSSEEARKRTASGASASSAANRSTGIVEARKRMLSSAGVSGTGPTTKAEVRSRTPSTLSTKTSSTSVRSARPSDAVLKPLKPEQMQTPKKAPSNGKLAAGDSSRNGSPTPRAASKTRALTAQAGAGKGASSKGSPAASLKSVKSTTSLRSAGAASSKTIAPPLPDASIASPAADDATLRLARASSPEFAQPRLQDPEAVPSPRPALNSETFSPPAPPSPPVSEPGPSLGTEHLATDMSASRMSEPGFSQRALKKTTLAHGIPCVVAPTQSGTRKPPRFRAVVKYIGELPGHQGSWLGVQVPPPLPPALADDTLGIESIKTDGTLDGLRYFDLGPPARRLPAESAPTSDSEVDEETRKHRERRQKRVQELLARSAGSPEVGGDATDKANDRGLGSELGWRRRREASSSRSSSFAGSPDCSSEASVGLFIRPEDVLWVVMPSD